MAQICSALMTVARDRGNAVETAMNQHLQDDAIEQQILEPIWTGLPPWSQNGYGLILWLMEEDSAHCSGLICSPLRMMYSWWRKISHCTVAMTSNIPSLQDGLQCLFVLNTMTKQKIEKEINPPA